MKVDHNANPAIQRGETPTAGRTERTSRIADQDATVAPASAEGASESSADISPRAHEFARAKELAAGAPDVREAKIAELKRRIASKEYNVKPESVADRMVHEHMQSHGLG